MVKTIFNLRCLSFPVVLLFACCVSAYGQLAPDRHIVHLKSGDVIPVANTSHWLDSMERVAPEMPVQVMVHFSQLPTKAQRESMKQGGVTLMDYLPENTFTALVRFPINKELILSMPVHSFLPASEASKSSSYVWRQVNSRHGAIEVLVSFYESVDASLIRQVIAGMGGQIHQGPLEKYGSYKVIIDAAKVHSLAQWYGTRAISPVTEMVPLDLESRPAVKGNIAVASPQHGGYGLTGDSVVVGVGDDASGIYHADIKDRILNFNPVPLHNHGAHVNGIVGGAGNIDPFAEGMAPHVGLIDFLYDLVLPATGAMYNDYHMTLTNNSYEVVGGDCDYAGTYDVYSRLLDTLSVQYPEVLHVFASGNDGYLSCSAYPQGFATVGGGYQPAKNNVVVGSMTDYYDDVYDESRGPVKDGRLKPEIEATGLIAYSTVGLDQYEWAAGTSMASPQVAGGLALLTQRYKQLNGGSQPRADLLKAILLNGAMDLGNPGPDYSHGFGEMNVYRSLQIIDSSRFTTGNVSNGDSQTFTINVPAGTGQVKVMLYWADPPASTSSSKQLVNDLDLTVTTPTGVLHLPLVLDNTPAHVNDNAVEKPDHLNNIEQVTVNTPVAGTYTVTVKGYAIPFGPQHFVLVYDFVPRALQLTYPLGGEQLLSASTPFDTVRVFWDAVTDGNTFKVEASQDNGGSWFTISDHVPAADRHCDFLPVGLSTGNFRIRVSRNNTSETATSGRLVLNAQPVVQLDTAQCPGYLNIHWSPVLNATGYYVWKKVGYYMKVVDSVTDTVYSYSNMPLNEYAYVAVQPKIDGLPGYRSLAIKGMANGGNCTGAVSLGDLMIEKVLSPASGRKFTSSEIMSNDSIKVLVRNLYSAACDSFALSWQLDGGLWHYEANAVSLPANSNKVITIAGPDLSAVGEYHVKIAVHNLRMPDPQSGNDTISVTVKQLPNDTINLAAPFFDGFEAMPRFAVQHDSIGVSPNGHWDYTNSNDTGRMRSFLNDDITISGIRSVSMDADQHIPGGSRNTFTGTFNLSNYDTASGELRVDFDYVLHGKPKTAVGNLVTARGADTAAWIPFYNYDFSGYPGNVINVHSLSLTDLVRLSHHNFSSSTQVSFGQNDTTLIATTNYGSGLTLDNFRIYTVANDVAITSVLSPLPNNCGLASPAPVTIRVHNGVNYTLHNVQLFYRLDGGTTYSGTIDSIKAKADIDFTFAQPIPVTTGATHSLSVWLQEAGDSYALNDSILNYQFRNNQIVTSYPYLENFESGDGGYYSSGFNNSWQYGVPASPKVHKAASGTHAWKTNLTGKYNNLEVSYLYSPCFDLSGMAQPMLSFSTAMDIENCGNTLCDAAYIEVSYDGVTWTKMGATGLGTNWYDSTFNVWNTNGFTRWHVASLRLPQPGPGYVTHFRFVLNADPGVTYEGIAVDDIHVFDLAEPIYAGPSVQLAKDLPAGQLTDYTSNGQAVASLQPGSQPISGAVVNYYAHDTVYNPGMTQFTFPRSYNVRAAATAAADGTVKLYLTEADVMRVLNDTTCLSCNKVADAYSLGVTQYSNSGNPGLENGTLTDDTGGAFIYHPYTTVKWVPYDNGYYAQLVAKPLSEYWFNDGGPTATFPAGVDYVNFTAYRRGSVVVCDWHSLIDTAVAAYTVQWSLDTFNFADALDTTARHLPVADYTFDDPVNFDHHPVLYYRLRWTMTGSTGYYYSPVRRVYGSDSAVNLMSFDAVMVNHHSVLTSWTSYLDGTVDHYVLQRAVGSGNFAEVTSIAALHRYGQSYSYTDQPAIGIPSGALVHYRLIAVMQDGASITMPDRTVEWYNTGTFVNLYPNPSHDGRFSIAWFADPGTVMHLNMVDITGRSIYSANVTATQWSNETTLQIGNKMSGIYIVKMDISGNRYTAKVVFE